MVATATLLLLAEFINVTHAPAAVALFAFASFVCAVVVQEFWRGIRARRALTGEAPPKALISLVSRKRRRYGGYIVHIGIAVTFVGVAASSAFNHVVDVELKPGQTASVGGYQITYAKPRGELKAASNGRLERIDLGADMRITRNGKEEGTIAALRSYFPSSNPNLGPLSRFFDGEATSEIGLRAGVRRDVWIAMETDLTKLRKRLNEGDRVFRKAKSLSAQQSNTALALALEGLANTYARDNPVARFHFMVSPLVTWIWLGAMIVLCGGLVAIWPARSGITKSNIAVPGTSNLAEPTPSDSSVSAPK